MVGTTRARISYFMNKFRNLGYIDYNGNISVRRSLSNVLFPNRAIRKTSSKPSNANLIRVGTRFRVLVGVLWNREVRHTNKSLATVPRVSTYADSVEVVQF